MFSSTETNYSGRSFKSDFTVIRGNCFQLLIMGICISVEGNDVYEPTANVILMDGGIQKFSGPVKVEEILKNNPGHFVCSSDGLYIGKFISEILPQEELQIGQLYFVLPRKKLGFVLCDKDMSSFF